MLTAILFTLAFASVLAIIFSGVFIKIENVFKGGMTIVTYTIFGVAIYVPRLFDPEPYGWGDVASLLFYAGLFVLQFGPKRGWDLPVERVVPGGWIGGFTSTAIVSGVSYHVFTGEPWSNLDLVSGTVLTGLTFYSLWEGWSKARDRKMQDDINKIDP